MDVENKNAHLELLTKKAETMSAVEESFMREASTLARAFNTLAIRAAASPEVLEAAAIILVVGVAYANECIGEGRSRETLIGAMRAMLDYHTERMDNEPALKNMVEKLRDSIRQSKGEA